MTNTRQRLIIAGSISNGKFPLVIIIFEELILTIAGTKRRPAQLHGRRKRHGRTDKFQATEQGAIHLKNTIAVGIEDGIYTVITCFKLVNIVTCTTFKIVTAFATI